MKTISLKISEGVLADIDQKLEQYRFSTRTEFIRQAIREKIDSLEKKRFEKEMRKYFEDNKSALKPEIEHAKDEVFKELERRFSL